MQPPGEKIEMTDFSEYHKWDTEDLNEEFIRLNNEDSPQIERVNYIGDVLAERKKGLTKETSFTDYAFIEDPNDKKGAVVPDVDANDGGGLAPAVDANDMGGEVAYIPGSQEQQQQQQQQKLIPQTGEDRIEFVNFVQ